MRMTMMQAERYVREFAEMYTTPNVLIALGLCEAGILQWDVIANLFNESLTEAVDAVKDISL